MLIVALPLLAAVDVIYVMLRAPLIDSSSGAITELSTVCALAPVYVVETCTVGGAISGYCSTGSDVRPIIPTTTIKIEITVDSTGRLIKLSNFIYLQN